MTNPAPDPPVGTVTFLFTDIEGSTRLLQALGEGYHRLLGDHHRILREACRDGYVAGTEGDAFFVVFRSPSAALEAALASQRAFRDHAWPDGVDLKVRMGLHTGEGTIAVSDYVGIDVNRAARIMAAAHGGQVLVSDATRALLEGALGNDIRFRDVGEHRLKDLPRAERLFQPTVADLPADFPPPRSLDAHTRSLPEPLTPFIGREEVLREVEATMRTCRLVTLTGPGGTGKTRLALQAATDLEAEYRDGAAFVALAPIVDPDLVPETIANVLGVLEEPGTPVLETLTAHLADREMLLVLDNLEQVIEAAPVVGALLAATPGLRAIATSREPLHVDGEQEFPVPPMALPPEIDPADPDRLDIERLADYESVALFLARARSVRPSFALDTATAPAVAAICARLDGLPLAIELAAARLRLFAPDQLLQRLQRALPELGGGGRDRPARQQTLRGAIGWSYDLLDDDERRVFRQLAVFRSGCTLEAAASVCDPAGELATDLLEVLGSLVDKSLLRVLPGDDEPRFRLLYVIREYATECLEESDESSAIRDRHARYLLTVASEIAPKLFGTDQAMWLDRLELVHDDLRAALSWAIGSGETALALALVSSFWRFWQMRGHLGEARERVDEVLALPDAAAHPAERAAALEAAGGVAYWMADWQAAHDRYAASLELRRTLGDPLATAEAAYNLGCIAIYGPPPFRSIPQASALLDEAVAIFRTEGDRLGLAKVLWATGGNLVDERPADAIAPFRESLDLYREVGDRFGEAWALHMLGRAESVSGHLDEGERHVRMSFDLFLEADDRSAVPILLSDFAVIAVQRGEFERALKLHGATQAIEAQSGVGLAVTASDIVGTLDRMWEALPREEADRHIAAGRAMSVEEAIAYALKTEG